MCLVLDQFLWGHSSRVCDISCFCLLPVSLCIDAYVTILSYVLVCVLSLITRLQLKKMSVMYESAHDTITFHLLEMSSITIPNQKQFRIFAQGTFFKGFLGKISAILRSCIMKKINLEVTYKQNRFSYWNSCKRLPNFVNVAAL